MGSRVVASLIMGSVRKLRAARRHYAEFGAFDLIKTIISMPYKRAKYKLATQFVRRRYTDLIVDSAELRTEYASRCWELDEELSGIRQSLLESGSEKLSTERVIELLPLIQSEQIEINNNPRFVFKQPFVAKVRNATVLGQDAICITSDGRLLLDPISSAAKESEPVNSRAGRELSSELAATPATMRALNQGTSPTSEQTISTACVLHSRWTNYYHWMAEHLPKLRGVDRYEAETGNTVTLIIPPNPPSYVCESLDLLGYTDYIEWDGTPTKVERLIVPSFPEYTPKTLAWLRRRMVRAVNAESDSPEWVYITRQKSDKRAVDNYDELAPILEEYGISPIACEELSVEEQVQLFSNAEGVIAPHGAGLTNILWGDDISVIELFPEVGIGCYFLLAHVLGHDYIAYSGKSRKPNKKPQNSNIEVDIDMLREVLDDHLSATKP